MEDHGRTNSGSGADGERSRNPSPSSEISLERLRRFVRESTAFLEAERAADFDDSRRRREELELVAPALARLRAYYQWKTDRRRSLKAYLKSLFAIYNRPRYPSNDELLPLVHHYFPPRGMLRVDVYDFGEDHAEHFKTTLGTIQETWGEKPDWATVRWIHAPLGKGPLQGSIVDIFLNSTRQHARPSPATFERSGNPGWSFPECEVLNIHEKAFVKDQRDVFFLLRGDPYLGELLNDTIFRGDRNQNLMVDLEWRAKLLNLPLSFWTLVVSDMPWYLNEDGGLDIRNTGAGLAVPERHAQEQIICKNALYENVAVMRDTFQCYHNEGFLLTLSPMAGLCHIERDLKKHLSNGLPDLPRMVFREIYPLTANFGKTIFAQYFHRGTEDWTDKNVEFLTVKLMTTLAQIPRTYFMNASLVQSAYQPIIRDLKNRRDSQFRRHESIALVRDYIACMNEISRAADISEERLDFLDRLRIDCQNSPILTTSNDVVNNSTVASMIDASYVSIKENHRRMQRMLADLKSSLDAYYQLRSIEQNEVAILAESNNRAILIFTGVTIVFLPLSFFTSYFGMNLQGISGTTKGEAYFWEVCGSVALFVVAATVIYAFKESIHRWLWDRLPDPDKLV